MDHSQILEIFNFRHACKSFDATKKVSDADFATILEAGRLSPSSFGFEPWQFLVIQNREVLEKLRAVAWGARNTIDGASHLVVLLARKAADLQPDSQYMQHIMRDVQGKDAEQMAGTQAFFMNFLQNEHKLLESDRNLFDWASKQTYIALGNMLTVAAAMRIDSCPIEGFNIEATEQVLADAGLLDRNHFGVSVMAGFGYRAEEPKRAKIRRPINEVVVWAK